MASRAGRRVFKICVNAPVALVLPLPTQPAQPAPQEPAQSSVAAEIVSSLNNAANQDPGNSAIGAGTGSLLIFFSKEVSEETVRTLLGPAGSKVTIEPLEWSKELQDEKMTLQFPIKEKGLLKALELAAKGEGYNLEDVPKQHRWIFDPLSIQNEIEPLEGEEIEGPVDDTMDQILLKTSQLQVSMGVKLKELLEKSMLGLLKTYPAPIPMLIEPSEDFPIEVLCVFLGPSSTSHATSPDARPNWNPFRQKDGTYCQSLKILDGKLKDKGFSLDKCYLVDAFPLLLWGPTPDHHSLWNHFNLGVQYISAAIELVKPKFVLAFGNASCWVVKKALNDVKVLKTNLSTNGNYQFNYGRTLETWTDLSGRERKVTAYFCRHPSSFQKHDVFGLPVRAAGEILENSKTFSLE